MIHATHHLALYAFATFHATLSTVPGEARTDEPVELSFAVKGEGNQNIGNLQIVHEKPMHLIVISDDLAEFYHIHPQLAADNTFRVPHVFPYGGKFKLFADYAPPGVSSRVESFELHVAGKTRSRLMLTEESTPSVTVEGLRVTLAHDAPITTGKDLRLLFRLADATTGLAVRDLEPYLGSWAHVVIISNDLNSFIHAHPINGSKHSHKVRSTRSITFSPSELQVQAGFRQPGLYKLWLQLQREGRVITVPFVLRASGPAQVESQPSVPAGAVLVTVSSTGFEPAEIRTKAGALLQLAFHRPDAQNCGSSVTFPDLGITTALRPASTTVVTIRPTQSGVLKFTCGMGMMRGSVVAR